MTITFDAETHSRLKGYRHEYDTVNVDDLMVDIRCQQPPRPTTVAKMQKFGFDIAAVGTITVSVRNDGTKVIIDGQTRWKCAKEVGVKHLPAELWHELSPADESWLFRRLNEKSNPPAIHKFRNDVNANDPDANGIVDILYKWSWDLSEGASADGKFLAVTVAKRIYTREGKEFRAKCMTGPELFNETIRVATMAWGHKREAVDGQLISGIAVLLAKYGDKVDTDLLIRKLGALTAIQVRAEGKRIKELGGFTPSLAQAQYMHTLYNKQLRSGKLPPFVAVSA